MTLLAGLAIIALAIYATLRRVDVRLALLLAALALGALGGDPVAVVRKFLATIADEKFVVPICSAMGFAYVVRHTGCDQHLVHLLVQPLRRVRALLIPGAVLVGFVVNIPVVSQTSTAVTIGSVMIPLLLAARLSPVTVGAALLLGSSVGGELLNPGAPELRTTVEETARAGSATPLTGLECVTHILPLNLVQLAVSTAVFWLLCLRAEKRLTHLEDPTEKGVETAPSAFQVNLLRAVVPVVPLLLLFLVAPPFELVSVPQSWLVEKPTAHDPRFDSRLIGAAMLVGVAVAVLVVRSAVRESARVFFDGAGYAFTHIISLIVTASCFGEGVKLIGLDELIGAVIKEVPALLVPASGLMSLGFAVLCGSGMAATQSLFPFFVGPALRLDFDPAHVGAVVSLAAAAGRTMSPVAAVTLMCAALTGTNPLDLVKRVAVPLLLGVAVMIIVASLMASSAALVYTE